MPPSRKVILTTVSLQGPTRQFREALERSIQLVKDAGWEEGFVEERGNVYISNARATVLRKALDARPDVVVFLDYDVSWGDGDLLKLLSTDGDVVAGTYRFKSEPEEYMGAFLPGGGKPPHVRGDGCVSAELIPAGFLKVTKEAINQFMGAYPELVYGPHFSPYVDLFNHGAYKRVWWGEDYAFSRRWRECGGELWVVPTLQIDHWDGEKCYEGNLHEWLLRRPGGSKDPNTMTGANDQ